MLTAPTERVTFESLAEDWRALAESADRSIFATPEWLEAWWQAFGRDRELLLRAGRDANGRLTSVLPLYVWRARRPRVIRFLGHGPGDELGPVFRPGEHDTAAGELRRALDALEWDVFLGEQLSGEDDWTGMLGGQRWRREANPVLRVTPGGWEEYLGRRSANFRQQLRRHERALWRSGRVRYRLADEQSLDGDLSALFVLHRARWGGGTTDFDDTPFHRDVARRALERGWLRLWSLDLDDRIVAVWLGFQVGRATSYYQAGRDPALDRLAVGTVLLAHSIREAMAERTLQYRFGRGAEPFKYRFTDVDPGLDSVMLARTAVGRAGVALAHAARTTRRLATSRRRG